MCIRVDKDASLQIHAHLTHRCTYFLPHSLLHILSPSLSSAHTFSLTPSLSHFVAVSLSHTHTRNDPSYVKRPFGYYGNSPTPPFFPLIVFPFLFSFFSFFLFFSHESVSGLIIFIKDSLTPPSPPKPLITHAHSPRAGKKQLHSMWDE